MQLFSIIKTTIYSSEFRKSVLLNPSSFTRNRQLSFEYIMYFFLIGAYKSLSVAIPEFIYLLSAQGLTFTKQALSKARKNISYEAFISLNYILIKEFFKQKQETFKGYRLLAVDGTKIELPKTKRILKFFGTDKIINKNTPRARAISFMDVLNNIIFNVKIYKYSVSERDCLVAQAKEIKYNKLSRKDIIIADRGFPSMAVFIELKQLGFDFVMRYNGEQFIKEFEDFPKSKQMDITRKVKPREIYKRKYKKALKKSLKTFKEEEIELRVVKIKLKKGKIEYLITSLTDKSKITKSNLRYIYNLRWGIEENFKYQKGIVQIENFSGKTRESILQDYYSKIVIMNLHLSITLAVNKKIKKLVKKKNERPKPKADTRPQQKGKENQSNTKTQNGEILSSFKYTKYKVNKSVSYGLLRLYFLQIISAEKHKLEILYNVLLDEIIKHKTPEINDRNNKRIVKDKIKYPTNNRRVV